MIFLTNGSLDKQCLKRPLFSSLATDTQLKVLQKLFIFSSCMRWEMLFCIPPWIEPLLDSLNSLKSFIHLIVWQNSYGVNGVEKKHFFIQFIVMYIIICIITLNIAILTFLQWFISRNRLQKLVNNQYYYWNIFTYSITINVRSIYYL